jgi:elongation factor 1-gamma
MYSAVTGELKFIDEAVKYTPPKKEPKKEVPKAEKKVEKPAADEEDEPAPAAPKAKHPLEALGKPTLALDDWKRKYSNEDTRPVALPWFWENFKADEYSLWAVDYKYNDELTLTFMSANLIGGFFARLEASRKYIFGCLSVYGQSNDSVIKGAFLIRGQEALPAMDVAPGRCLSFSIHASTNQESFKIMNRTYSPSSTPPSLRIKILSMTCGPGTNLLL